jgi:IS30 family transposase
MTYRQLTTEERYQIAARRQQGCNAAEIARGLGRHRSTIAREVKRNATPYDGAYRPNMAMEMTNGRRSRSRRNSRYGPVDFAPIEVLLACDWSPEQIVGRRRCEGLRVMSHETIYLHIWKDKENGGSLWRHLRGAAKQRRKRYGRYDSRGRLAGKRMIGERPAIVNRRRRFGDWELDTVHGRGKPCVVTAVERKSGVVRIGPLPRATVEHTNARTIELLSNEPHRVRTLTSDNGAEFHGYKQLEQALRATVYFATPHHAWERGTNENTNGLLRQYLPKGTPLGELTPRQCNAIAAKLNHRPRRRLRYRTPHEVYHGSVLPHRH